MKTGFLLLANKAEPGAKISVPYYRIVPTNPVSVEVFSKKSPEIGVTRCVVESLVVADTKKRVPPQSLPQQQSRNSDEDNDTALQEHFVKVVKKLREMETTGK